MMTKTGWLDWVHATTARLQQGYRDVWTRLQRTSQREQPAPESKKWSAIKPVVERKQSGVEIHLELPQPHTVEAEVQIIGSSLVITVLRQGSGIDGALVKDCYRRSIPLPEGVDPTTAEHRVYGGEIVIRMEPSAEGGSGPQGPATPRRKPVRTNARKSAGKREPASKDRKSA